MERHHYHSAICDPSVFILHYTEEDEREMRDGVGGSDERGARRLGGTAGAEAVREKRRKEKGMDL